MLNNARLTAEERRALLAPAEVPEHAKSARIPPVAKRDSAAGTGGLVPADRHVGRRPPSRPPRRSRNLALMLAAAILAITTALGLRYGLPRTVEAVPVTASTLTVELSGPGTLDAINKAAVSARTQGRLTELLVDRNDTVAVGSLLARIASDVLASELAAAVASSEAATRAVREARADRDSAEAAVANARTAFERQATLLGGGWTTRAAYDDALATRRRAVADLMRAAAAVEAAEAQERAAAATAKASEAELDETVVRAPFAGVIVARDSNVGNLVTPGTSIVQLVDPSTLVLTARFDEAGIAAVRAGQAAILTFPSEPGRSVTGRVLRLSRQIDTETREFTVDIVPDALPENWAIGQRAVASIIVAHRVNVLSVPSRMLAWRDGKAGLWVSVDGRARWRSVAPGEAGRDRVEVRGGLADGDMVLNPDDLFEGARVRAAEAKS